MSKTITDQITELQEKAEKAEFLTKLFEKAVKNEFGYSITEVHTLLARQIAYENRVKSHIEHDHEQGKI